MRRRRPPFWFEETFDRIRRLEDELYRAFSELWKGFEFSFPEIKFPEFQEVGRIAVDVAETKNEIIVRADLPGYRKDEIKVKATEDSVVIEALKREEKKEQEENFFRQERRIGAIKRVIPLPVQVIPENAKAKFENGVLEIRLPKAEPEKEKEREIEIE